jgi:N-acetylneuraminate lyase
MPAASGPGSRESNGWMSASLQGVVPAILTPLTENEDLAVSPFEKLLERVYAAGSDGVYVCGQTGEGLTLPAAVRKKAAEAAIRNTPAGRSVIVHIGAGRTADAVELARHAARSGAQAVSSLPPDSRYSFEEAHRYYSAIAAASEVPVLVYYFPEYSTAVRTLEQIDELCAIAAGLLMGACGGIGSFYNLAPELFVEVYRHARAGQFADARRVQDRINDLIRAVLQFPMLAAMKTLLAWSGIPVGNCAAPRRGLTAEEEIQLRRKVKAAGFAPDGFLAAAAS